MPDEQGERQVEQRARAEQGEADDEDGRDREQRDDGGVDRPDERLVDGEVGRLRVGHPARGEGLGRVLPHLVEDDDGVVEGVAEDRQEADHRRRRDLEPEEGVDPDRDDEVVQQRDETGDGHLPRAEVEGHHDRHEDEEDDEAAERLLVTVSPQLGPMSEALTAPGSTPNVEESADLASAVRSAAASVWTRTVFCPTTVETTLPWMPASPTALCAFSS